MQIHDEPLAKNVRGARFPLSVDATLGKLENQSDFIRTAVIDRLIAEGLLESNNEEGKGKLTSDS